VHSRPRTERSSAKCSRALCVGLYYIRSKCLITPYSTQRTPPRCFLSEMAMADHQRLTRYLLFLKTVHQRETDRDRWSPVSMVQAIADKAAYLRRRYRYGVSIQTLQSQQDELEYKSTNKQFQILKRLNTKMTLSSVFIGY